MFILDPCMAQMIRTVIPEACFKGYMIFFIILTKPRRGYLGSTLLAVSRPHIELEMVYEHLVTTAARDQQLVPTTHSQFF